MGKALPVVSGLVAIAVSASIAVGAPIGPWPQWQGPDRNNVSRETGLLKKWPEGGPTLAWKAHGLGGGFSTVSVADGKIYTMGDLSDGCYVIALNLDGQPLWKQKIGRAGGGGGYPGPRCEPAVSGQNVVALGQFGDLACLDAASGAIKWHTNLERDFHGKMMSGWGYSESPLIDAGRVICTPGGNNGTLLALDLATGRPVWRCTQWTDPAAYASPIPAQVGGAHQYIQLTGEHVGGVSADDGKLLWLAKRHGGTAVIPTPIFKDDEVFVTSGYQAGCNLFKITHADGKFSASEVYANRNMQNHHGGVVLVGDYLYGSSDPGILTCMDFQTGAVKWKDRSVGKASLTCADGRLYVRAESTGDVALVEATPSGYHESGILHQPDRSHANAWPHPVVADGKLYLRDQDVLLCYDVKAK